MISGGLSLIRDRFLVVSVWEMLLGGMLKGRNEPRYAIWDIETGKRIILSDCIDMNKWDAFVLKANERGLIQYTEPDEKPWEGMEDDFRWVGPDQDFFIEEFGITFNFGQHCCFFKDGEILEIFMTWKELEPFIKRDSPLRVMYQ